MSNLPSNRLNNTFFTHGL